MASVSLKVLAAVGAATGGAALWWRRNPSACPYAQRFWLVEIPRPGIGVAGMLRALDVQPGERLLELGPGTGYYTLPVAGALGPEGRLDILDIQEEMLDHTMRRVAEAGLANVEPSCADATSLPYDDDSFDGAFLVTVLGEIPDQQAAVNELARVVKPGGRVVFGETYLDPHVVTARALKERTEAAGLSFESRSGNPVAWLTRFRVG